MFTAALFTITNLWKQPKCPLMDDWIKKKCCVYAMECYSAIKTNEILLFESAWMDLEGIMLSEISKDKYYMISFTYES